MRVIVECLKCQQSLSVLRDFPRSKSLEQKFHGSFVAGKKLLDQRATTTKTIASLTMSGTTAKLDEYVSKADATLASYSSVTQYGEFHFNHWKIPQSSCDAARKRENSFSCERIQALGSAILVSFMLLKSWGKSRVARVPLGALFLTILLRPAFSKNGIHGHDSPANER